MSNTVEQKKELEALGKKKLFMFDIDGTLAVGDTLYDGSRQILEYIKRIGGEAIFVTNNSTKSSEDYQKKFQTVYGLETRKEQFVTSGFMTRRFLKKHYADQKIFVMATQSVIRDLRENGLIVTEKDEDDIACVMVAYDSELRYDKLEEICKVLMTRDVPFYGTNPDLRCPIDFGFVPDCGAICHMITDTTDKIPTYMGKPSEEVVNYCLELTGFSKEETLVVGDRFYTDIACGMNGGVDTCLVFTGEATKEDLKDTPFQPTYALENIKELYEVCENNSVF